MPTSTVVAVREELRSMADPATAEFLQRFFKTGPGEYGEGDRFLGVRVPRLRALARAHRSLPLEAVLTLLRSEWHEERLLALLILAAQFPRSDAAGREEIFRAYLENTRYIDSWDLVDSSAPLIVGAHLDIDRIDVLERLARADSVWERRIAVLSTLAWIRRGTYEPTFRVATMLLHDAHDLIHRAVGWMLREVGERDPEREEAFLREHYRSMPRTMLRYAIEKFPEPRRKQYLRGEA